MKAVCLWSGPRNVSTALMYSFAQRADTIVVDEPLYGHYLRVSGARHPLRAEVLAAVNSDGNAVMRQLLHEPAEEATTVLFMKQMAFIVGPFQQTEEVVSDTACSGIVLKRPSSLLKNSGFFTGHQVEEWD
jgi:hypothetical protein